MGALEPLFHSASLSQGLTQAWPCSTYYGFCGTAGSQQEGVAGSEIKAQVCSKWLHPIDMREHPAFASWVIYGALCLHWAACDALPAY